MYYMCVYRKRTEVERLINDDIISPTVRKHAGQSELLLTSHLLFVQQDGDDDADDKDNSQNRSYHPDESVSGVQRLGVRVGRDDRVRVATGDEHLLNTRIHRR